MSTYKPDTSRFYHFDFQFRRQRFHGSTGCTSKRDADRYEAERRREVALGINNRPDVTLDAACEAYWTETGQRESSKATTFYQLENLCRGLGGRRCLHTITQADFEDYIRARRKAIGKRSKRPLSAASINREWQLARRVWKLAAKRFNVPLPGSPEAIDWAALKLDEPKERVRELRRDQEADLLAILSPELAALAEFSAISGQRKSEVIGLRWSDIDWSGPRATVTAKGGHKHTFPLSPRLVVLILAQPSVAGCDNVFTYVCKRSRGRRLKGRRYPFSKQGWRKDWINALKQAGITDFRFHDLRHTAATRIMRATGNLKAAQRLLGHTTIATTARYAHVNEDDLAAAMRVTESRNSPKHVRAKVPENG